MSTLSVNDLSVYSSLNNLSRSSLSDSVADQLRDLILSGKLAPGDRLSEPDIIKAMSISRNTLREAFHILIKERLARHELNRGVFVRKPTAREVTTIFNCRRLIECAAIREAGKSVAAARESQPSDHARQQYEYLQRCLPRLDETLAYANEIAGEGRWTEIGAANIEFHKALVALGASNRLDELMTNIWHEAGLIQHLMPDTQKFGSYMLQRNMEVSARIADGNFDEAEKLLEELLREAEQLILEQFSETS